MKIGQIGCVAGRAAFRVAAVVGGSTSRACGSRLLSLVRAQVVYLLFMGRRKARVVVAFEKPKQGDPRWREGSPCEATGAQHVTCFFSSFLISFFY